MYLSRCYSSSLSFYSAIDWQVCIPSSRSIMVFFKDCMLAKHFFIYQSLSCIFWVISWLLTCCCSSLLIWLVAQFSLTWIFAVFFFYSISRVLLLARSLYSYSFYRLMASANYFCLFTYYLQSFYSWAFQALNASSLAACSFFICWELLMIAFQSYCLSLCSYFQQFSFSYTLTLFSSNILLLYTQTSLRVCESIDSLLMESFYISSTNSFCLYNFFYKSLMFSVYLDTSVYFLLSLALYCCNYIFCFYIDSSCRLIVFSKDSYLSFHSFLYVSKAFYFYCSWPCIFNFSSPYLYFYFSQCSEIVVCSTNYCLNAVIDISNSLLFAFSTSLSCFIYALRLSIVLLMKSMVLLLKSL